MPLLQALICDLDMTLVDSRRDIATALVRSIELKIGPTVDDAAAAKLIGRPLVEMIRTLVPAALPAQVEETVAEYKRYFFDHCAEHSTVYPGVVETLSALRTRGALTAVATTKMTFMAKRVCETLGLDAYFDHIQGTDDFPAKPGPEVLRRACAALGVAPDRAVVVGDTVFDQQAAVAVGALPVGVAYGIDERGELKAAGAKEVVEEFGAVVNLFEA